MTRVLRVLRVLGVLGVLRVLGVLKVHRVLTVRWCAMATAAALVAGSMATKATGQTNLGIIKGHVVLTGKEPGNPFIRMRVDPKCSALNAGHRVIQESALIAVDGSIANVFVRLIGTFPQTPVPAEPVVIDQRACFYRPRVVGMRVGQTLQIKNDDELLHNVHSSSAAGNSFNVGQPKAGIVFSFTPKAEEVMLPIGCDVHRWMTAYVGIVAHPYFSVTGADGTFAIAKIPAGTYTIKTWHERFGEVEKKVTVRAGTTATVDFAYASKP